MYLNFVLWLPKTFSSGEYFPCLCLPRALLQKATVAVQLEYTHVPTTSLWILFFFSLIYHIFIRHPKQLNLTLPCHSREGMCIMKEDFCSVIADSIQTCITWPWNLLVSPPFFFPAHVKMWTYYFWPKVGSFQYPSALVPDAGHLMSAPLFMSGPSHGQTLLFTSYSATDGLALAADRWSLLVSRWNLSYISPRFFFLYNRNL